MAYSSRSMRRRRDTDKWEVVLSHRNPISGKMESSYHTVTAKTESQARKKRGALLWELNTRGSAIVLNATVHDLLDSFIGYKTDSGGIEPSTANQYRKDARVVNRYIGDVRLADTSIATISSRLVTSLWHRTPREFCAARSHTLAWP